MIINRIKVMVKEANDKNLLKTVLETLSQSDITCWVFGGWAEELRGLDGPRKHKDIDLLYPADDFCLVDNFLKNNKQFSEVKGKHFFHKRAFFVRNVIVELFLVQTKTDKLITNFFGRKEYFWPKQTIDSKKIDGFLVASEESLKDYRLNYDRFH